MKKIKKTELQETKKHLYNEMNKVEIAEDLIYCYDEFLVKIMKGLRGDKNYFGKKYKISAEDISNFLEIIRMKEQHLRKIYKIF